MPQAASVLNCQASGQAAILLVPQKVSHQILLKGAARVILVVGLLSLTLFGMGVASMITCSIDGNILNMGYVLARESVSTNFKVN